MFLILLGAPGTGKGTQAQLLAEKEGWLHISTGEMLRGAVTSKTFVGEAVKKYMDQGALVPDELIVDMLIERLAQPDAQEGVILDGFPRNITQARALDDSLDAAGKAVDLAINIAVPDEEIVSRLSSRWICRQCGRIYSFAGGPPGHACQRCGGELYQREDDKPETVRARLQLQKPPANLMTHYRKSGKLVEINGLQTVEKVTEQLLAVLNEWMAA